MSLSLVEQAVTGLPHEHLRRPWHAVFVGDISPQSDPLRYVNAVQQLYGRWCEEVQARRGPPPPLLINTNGWIKVASAFPPLSTLVSGLLAVEGGLGMWLVGVVVGDVGGWT